jgi:hypothetical protein
MFIKSPETASGLPVHEGSLLHGKRGVFLVFLSLLMLSTLLNIMSGIFIGASVWWLGIVGLWAIFLVYLFRFKAGVLGFWKLVFAFMIYFLAICALLYLAVSPRESGNMVIQDTVQQ